MGTSVSVVVLVVLGLFVLLPGLAVISLRSVKPPNAIRLLGRRFFCPRTGAETDCTLSKDDISGRYVGVARCTERERWPSELCHEECVGALNQGGPLWRAGSDRAGLSMQPAAPGGSVRS